MYMNYVLEGQENFNDRLLSALCDETNANQDEKICLISNTILEKNAITITAGIIYISFKS